MRTATGPMAREPLPLAYLRPESSAAADVERKPSVALRLAHMLPWLRRALALLAVVLVPVPAAAASPNIAAATACAIT